MKRLLLSVFFVLTFAFSAFANEGEADMFESFYSSMYEGCVSSLTGYNNAKAYCSCSTDNFKNNFSQKDREELLNLALSIANKSADAQNQAIEDYMMTPKMEAIINNSAQACLFILTGSK